MYIIVELQTAQDGTCSHLVYTTTNEDEAWSKYHQILSYAAVSSLPAHAAVILSNDGTPIANHCYIHEVAPIEE